MVPGRQNATVARRRCGGGTLANLITGLVFFGLIGYGVFWVLRTTGEAGKQYATAMVNTHNQATALSCQMNLRAISQTLQTFALSNEAFPANQQELVSYAGYGSKLFHCPDPNGGEYIYVPGVRGDAQRRSAPRAAPDAVVVYENKPVHNGKCNVLFLDGRIALLTPEELQLALQATGARTR